MDPPYYPNQLRQQENFSKKFKKIYFIKKRNLDHVAYRRGKPSPKFCDILINDFPLAQKFKSYYKRFNKKIQLILGIYAFLFSKEILNKKTNQKKNMFSSYLVGMILKILL